MSKFKVINTIIQEEVESVLTEQLIQEQTVSDWSKVKKLFQQIDKYPTYFSGLETFTFTDVENGRVQLFSDGTAYTGLSNNEKTWKYSVSNNVPDITIDGTPLNIIKTAQQRKEKSAERSKQTTVAKQKSLTKDKAPSTIDTIQTAMDWLGLIPGYGDIIDAVNAIIYFSRGKYLEGTLSLVAIIPVVGSGIKLGFKGAIQTLGGMSSASKIWKQAAGGSSSSITQLTKFYQEAVASGKLSKSHLKLVADKGDAVANILLKGKKYFGPGVDRQIDRVIGSLNNTVTRPIRQSFASKVVAAAKASKAAKTGGNVLNKVLTIGSVGVYSTAKNILKKYGVGTRELKLLKDAMDVRWAKQLINSPDKTALIFKSNKKYSAAEAASFGIPPWLQVKSFSQIRDWMDNVKQTDPLKWKKISEYIARTSTDNKLYKTYVENTFSQASNIFRPGAVATAGMPEMFSKIIKLDSYRLSNPKNVDIVYNELEDFAEKIGWDTEDNPQGVIMPALYMVYNNYLKTYVEQPVATVTGVAAGLGIGSVGNADQSATVDEPSTISTVGSQIKIDFKNASGQTTDRLATLREKGYSEEEILTLKRELDIE
jgi:hypothetical protein